MAKYRVTGPDGSVYEVNAPDGATEADVIAYAKSNFQKPPEKPAAVSAGESVNSIPRQIGLTARYGLEGLANTAQIATEPIRYLTDRLTGSTGKTVPLGTLASQFADKIGLPSPDGANERVVADATRLMAGAGGTGALSGAVSKLPGMLGEIGGQLSANMGQQVSAAAGAGLAGGASREAGGGPLMQTGAAVLGSLAGAGAASGADSVATLARRVANSGMSNADMDAKISVLLNRAGVDYSLIPEKARQSLRADLASALKADQNLDPAAVARLADFKLTGTTPTLGSVTRDPVQFTKEQNLAKIAANSNDGMLQGLPRIQNQNNSQLIGNLNNLGANQGNQFNAGDASINAILGRDAALKSRVTAAYDAARSLPGSDIPLDRKPIIDSIFGELIASNRLSHLPEGIANQLNTISKGQIVRDGQKFDVPFNANTIDNLMTDVAAALRSAQGPEKYALGVVMDNLKKANVQPVKNTFGGNQLVTQEGANFLRGQDAQAGQFLDAINKAKQTAAQRFGWQESSKPVEAALAGAAPDNFVKRFLINGDVRDAEALSQVAPKAELRNAIMEHLKSRALSGASDEVGKFSQAGFNKALNEIGDRKLSLFFTPEEINVLKANGRVASYIQAQPAGSAVNNSNSGALVVGKAYDALKGAVGMIPGAGPVVSGALDLTLGNPTKNAAQWLAQRNAMNVRRGLLVDPNESIMNGLLGPGVAYGGGVAGLLAAP